MAMNHSGATGTFSTQAISVLANGSFFALKLRRLTHGVVVFDYHVLQETWIAGGRTPESLQLATPAQIRGFIVRWYAEHALSGGAATREHDDLIDHLLREDPTKVRMLPM